MTGSRSVPIDLTDGPIPVRLERTFDEVEIRVLGSLMEKQQTTPDQYPLTLNSLRLACNQTSNRDPVMALEEPDVESALGRLQVLRLVWKIHRGRALRWEHKLDAKWSLGRPHKAIMTVLLLRGAQTPGELRTRTDRMHQFGSLEEIDEILDELASASEPLVVMLPRATGQKETRWMHLAGGPVEPSAAIPAPRPRTGDSLASRVETLEQRIEELERELNELKNSLGS